MTEVLTLYTAKICPYAHRVEIALDEVKRDYTRFEIDLRNKPEWYAPKVNPASKVPAIAYGGPKVSPDQPSPESVKIAESLILLDFVNDIDNEHRLLPKDPVLKAQARFFIDTFSNKFQPLWQAFLAKGEPIEPALKGLETLQALLPTDGKYAVGDFSIADIAVAPFFARMDVALKNDIGAYDEGEGKKVHDLLQNDERFTRFKNYFTALKERPSFQKTFDEEYIAQVFGARFQEARAQRSTSK